MKPTDSLEEKLSSFAGRTDVVFVIEGVFMYLEEDALENGYTRTGSFSVIDKAMDYGSKRLSEFVLNTFLRTLARGYAIYVLEAR
jgi:O-methyltransferase involved in polyketide biosynthesis